MSFASWGTGRLHSLSEVTRQGEWLSASPSEPGSEARDSLLLVYKRHLNSKHVNWCYLFLPS